VWRGTFRSDAGRRIERGSRGTASAVDGGTAPADGGAGRRGRTTVLAGPRRSGARGGGNAPEGLEWFGATPWRIGTEGAPGSHGRQAARVLRDPKPSSRLGSPTPKRWPMHTLKPREEEEARQVFRRGRGVRLILYSYPEYSPRKTSRSETTLCNLFSVKED